MKCQWSPPHHLALSAFSLRPLRLCGASEPVMPGWDYERAAWEAGHAPVAGVDEAGRGPLAGPVVAAAVVLPPEIEIPGLDDSKRLTPEEREALYGVIMPCAVAVA